MTNLFTFEEIYERNKRRIHYQIHRLSIQDSEKEFFQEGLCAMWHAYEKYNPDKGPMSTYFNYTIRNRLIDLLRKQRNEQSKQANYIQETLPRYRNNNHPASSSQTPLTDLLLDNPTFYQNLKAHLTEKQWKWLYYAIIKEMPIKDIADQESTTIAAVKSWGQQTRKK